MCNCIFSCLKNGSAKFMVKSQFHPLRHLSTSRFQFHGRFSSAFDSESRSATVNRIEKLHFPNVSGLAKTYAILISLCRVDGVPSLLYTVRSSELKSHSGQVSFPGGACDSTDRDVIHAALRETEEEIGIPQHAVDVWCTMPPISPNFDKLVYPVIGDLGNLVVDDLKCNQNEVSKIFTVPLDFMCDHRNYRHTVFRWKSRDGQKQIIRPHPLFLTQPRVWGLTANATELFLHCLLPELFSCPHGRFSLL